MARRQVAPVLSVNLRNPPSGWYGTEELAEMRAELRALLAVARAAEWDHKARWSGCPYDGNEPCKVCRALARLSRAGRAKEDK